MITGAHFLFYSKNPEADRAFLRDVLGFRWVNVGEGWLVFALPPSEIAVHPASGNFAQVHAGHELLGAVLYLMCDNLAETIKELETRGVRCSELEKAPWGTKTTVPLPSGGEIGLYQPAHPTAIGLPAE